MCIMLLSTLLSVAYSAFFAAEHIARNAHVP